MLSSREICKNIQRDKSSLNVVSTKIHEDFKIFFKLMLELNKHNILDNIEFYMCANSQYHFYKST